MIKAVLDTNVLVSAACLSESLPAQLLRLWLDRRFEMVLSEGILREFVGVMRRPKISGRYGITDETIETFFGTFRDLAQIVAIQEIPDIHVADPADIHVLACAASAKAGYIVTGDRHLLDLERYDDIEIVTPARFYADLQTAGLV